MTFGISYDEFSNRYFALGMELADITIAQYIKKNGSISQYIDVELVKQVGVSFALERVYNKYDVDREGAASLKTYMGTVVHNAVISELQKAWTDVKKSHPELVKKKDKVRDSIKYKAIATGVSSMVNQVEKRDPHNYMEASDVYERKEKVLDKMMECLQKLSPTDQVILKYWMEDDVNYVERTLEHFGIESSTKSHQMVRTRCNRAKERLKKLMGGAKPDYRDVYIPTGEFREDAVQVEEGDRNLERRRTRAIKRELGAQMDYRQISTGLYDKLVD